MTTAPHSGPDADSGRVYRLLAILILIVGTLALFSPILKHDFVDWDDPANVAENPYYNPVNAATVPRFWHAPYNALYMPVTYTLWAGCAVAATQSDPSPRPDGGTNALNPSPFHAASLLLHVVNVLLVFALLRFLLTRIARERPLMHRDAAAFLGALFFSAHPLQVESVAWITGMNNLTAGFFSLAALLVYLRAAEQDKDSPETEKQSVLIGMAVATVLFALALLSKPTAAAVPLVAVLLDWFVIGRSWLRIAVPISVWCALTLVCVLVTQSSSASSNIYIYLPVPGRPVIVLDALAFYLAKLIYPARLCVDYGRLPRLVLHSWWGYATCLAPLALVVAAWKLRWRLVLLGFALLVLFTLPMLGVIPYYFQGHSTVADRYLYLGLIGPALVLAGGIVFCPDRYRRGTYIVAGALIAYFALFSSGQISVWLDTTSLFQHVLTINPRSNTAYNNLGDALNRQGRTDEANACFVHAIQIVPNDHPALYNLGSNLGRAGRYAEALPLLQRSALLDPNYAPLQNNLGLVLEKLGRREEALAAYETALRVQPDFAPAQNNRNRLRAELANGKGR